MRLQLPGAAEAQRLGEARRTHVSDKSPRIDGSGSPLAEVANLGLVRPPLVYLSAIVLGLVVHVLSASAHCAAFPWCAGVRSSHVGSRHTLHLRCAPSGQP